MYAISDIFYIAGDEVKGMEILGLIILVACITVLSCLRHRHLSKNVGSGMGKENWERLSGEKDNKR